MWFEVRHAMGFHRHTDLELRCGWGVLGSRATTGVDASVSENRLCMAIPPISPNHIHLVGKKCENEY